jgi:hypothetical protein
MDADIRDLVEQIHAVPRQVVLAVTGGGATAAAWLLAVPGASRTILEVTVPYAQQSLAGYLGREPSAYCSAATARELAVRARERAAYLAPGAWVAGIGCTASLRSDRPKRGEHRAHVAAATETGALVQSLTLAKEQRDREGEEIVVSRLIVNALAEALALPERLALPLLPGEVVIREEQAGGLLARFLAGEVPAICVEPDGRLRSNGPMPGLLLAGSFNPLHEGHCTMATVAERVVGKRAAFELSAINAEKAALSAGEVRQRMGQFAWRAPLWLTRAPTFAEKCRLFGGVVFVVGADTAGRIVQPRFYGDSVEAMRAALEEIRAAGGRFLVAGRVMGENFVELEQMEIPAEFRDLFMGIAPGAFRVDVSSTQLRAAKG